LIDEVKTDLNGAIDSVATDVNIRITELEDKLNDKIENLSEGQVSKKMLGDLLIDLGKMEMNEKDRLEVLKDILFTDDREYLEKVAQRIEYLEKKVDDPERISSEVNPIVNQQLKEFTKSIPTALGPAITAALKEEIKNHKEEVIDVLFPILGKMVKKYVAQEMKLLSAKIEQVLLIERESGLLTASYSAAETIDEEMISGMLTAIKNFVEDAFSQKNQNLELIEYELYHIHLQSFVTYYIAVVISGNYPLKSKDKLQDIIFNFYEGFIMKKTEDLTEEIIKEDLAESFGNASI